MKKLKTLFVALLICVTTCFSFLFTSCSSTETYTFESLIHIESNVVHTVNAGDTYKGIQFREDSFILIIHEDNVFTLKTVLYLEDGNLGEGLYLGTWRKGTNNEIYLFYNYNTETVATKDGTRISFDFDSLELTLKK